MKSRQQLRAQVASGSYASEGLFAHNQFTRVRAFQGVRSGVLLTQREMIGTLARGLVEAYSARRKSSRPLQPFHKVLHDLSDTLKFRLTHSGVPTCRDPSRKLAGCGPENPLFSFVAKGSADADVGSLVAQAKNLLAQIAKRRAVNK